MSNLNQQLSVALCAILLLIIFGGCKQVESTELNVKQAIKEAQQRKDTRLYATSGRRLILPGISTDEQEQAIAQCGKKFLKGTGDAISNTKQREQRKKLILFMASYNKQMSKICQAQL